MGVGGWMVLKVMETVVQQLNTINPYPLPPDTKKASDSSILTVAVMGNTTPVKDDRVPHRAGTG